MKSSIALLAGLAFTSPALAGTVHLENALADQKDKAQFESSATLENITGVSHKVTASLDADDADLSKCHVRVAVDLTALDSGKPGRDKDMRESFLQTDKYPEAVFDSTKVEASQKTAADGQSVDLKVIGNFSLHGVTKELTIPVHATYVKGTPETAKLRHPGDIVHATAEWWIKLSDFNIPLPQMLVLKVADQLKCSVDVIFFGGMGEQGKKG